MANSVYYINKGVNRSIQFRGLKAQYIAYLVASLFAMLILYGLLYAIGINQYLIIIIVLGLGAAIVWKIYQLNNKYGEHGMMKTLAAKRLPRSIKCNSRKIFRLMKEKNNPTKTSYSERSRT